MFLKAQGALMPEILLRKVLHILFIAMLIGILIVRE
jgi:hypothetical protein